MAQNQRALAQDQAKPGRCVQYGSFVSAIALHSNTKTDKLDKDNFKLVKFMGRSRVDDPKRNAGISLRGAEIAKLRSISQGLGLGSMSDAVSAWLESVKGDGGFRRPCLEVPLQYLDLFDSYTPDELSELMARALASMSPGIELGDRVTSVVRPAEPVSPVIVRLFVRQTQIQLLYPEKRETFRDLVKALDYSWSNPYWLRSVQPDLRVDRAAEVAHRLLMAGFCVQIESNAVKEKAIAASYEPEHYRRIDAAQQSPWTGWFQVRWPRDEDLYDEAKKITGAKYSEGSVYVPTECFADVQDFADMHDFWLTPEAEILMSKAEQSWNDAQIICPNEHRKRQRRQKAQPPQPALAEVPDELRDDD